MTDANKKTRMRLWAVAFWLVVWEAAARLVCKEILLVSPPALRPGISRSAFGDSFSEDAIAVSEELGSLYQEAALKKGCHFVNAAEIIVSSEEDHLHLTAEEHGKLALALADQVRRIFKKEEP